MTSISLEDLRRDPDTFLDRVEAGEHLVVSRESRPVAELRPIDEHRPIAQDDRPLRPYGLDAGAFIVPDDFDAPMCLVEDVA